jgi:hypothetical protein
MPKGLLIEVLHCNRCDLPGASTLQVQTLLSLPKADRSFGRVGL